MICARTKCFASTAAATTVTCDLHPSSSVSYDLIPIADYLMSITYYLTSIADYLTSIAETQRGWPRGAIPLFGFPEDSALRRNPPLETRQTDGTGQQVAAHPSHTGPGTHTAWQETHGPSCWGDQAGRCQGPHTGTSEVKARPRPILSQPARVCNGCRHLGKELAISC